MTTNAMEWIGAEIEAMRAGAQNAVSACMNVTPGDRVYVLTDRVTHIIGQLLGEEAMRRGARALVRDLEDVTARPVTEVPERLRAEIMDFAPTVTFYAASSQPGEVAFRMGLRMVLVNDLHVRHGHMPGVTPNLMIDGMRTDYTVIERVTLAVYELARRARTVHVSTPDGTDLTTHFSPSLKWIPSTGVFHEPGDWGNLPDGETFTCPETMDGALVAHVLGDYFSEKYGVLRHPVTIDIHNGRVTGARSADQAIADEFLAYLDSAENGRRAGEFAIGTNIGLERLVGNLLQDEKLPGLHVAFGNPYPDATGADWSSRVHVDVIAVRCTITVDGQVIMRDGQFDFDALGLSALA